MNIHDLKKRRVIDEFLSMDHVLVHVDSRNMDIKVPQSFANNPRLTLKISRLFNYPPELKEDGIYVSLKFFGVYEECFLPWSSLWGATNDAGETTLWVDNYLDDKTFLDNESVQENEVKEEPSKEEKSTPEDRRAILKRIK